MTGLVDSVTAFKMEYGDSAQAETIRKMVVAMSRDACACWWSSSPTVCARTQRLRQAVERAEKGT